MILKTVISVYKPISWTPLQVVQKFKGKLLEYKNEKIGYAGRLDPMAHGVLVLLIGDENKKKDKYLSLDKTYECKILFGFSTDSFDILGKVVKVSNVPKVSKEIILEVLERYEGKQVQEYPPFSSKTFKGKPLYKWSREDRLNEVIMPTREIEIFSITLLDVGNISSVELQKIITQRIGKVVGDFRQKEILKEWKKLLEEKSVFSVATISLDCSSGTYIRSLADKIGKEIKVPSLAFDIFRTRVGDFPVSDSLRLF